MGLGSRFLGSIVWLVLGLAACSPLPDEVASTQTESTDATGDPTAAASTTTEANTRGSADETSTGAESLCGNGIVEEGEACDDAGESLLCNDDCTSAACGDGIVNVAAGEVCDGAELVGATCEGHGFDGGMLACTPECAFDEGGCANLPDAPVLKLGFSPIKQFEFTWAAVPEADYYQLEESIAPAEPFVPLPGDIMGESISLSMPLHLRWEASYRVRACNVAGCTSSMPMAVMSSLAEAVGYFKPSNTEWGDTFGGSVALSGDGNTLAIGSDQEDSNATGIDGNQADNSATAAGAVSVFVRDGMGGWSQAAYVKASNTDAGDLFGTSVALSDDGDTLAVGAPAEQSNATGIGGNQADDSASYSGAVYVFVRDGMGQWSQAAYVKASNTDMYDSFGTSVALSDDGDTLAVGAHNEDSNATGIGGNQVDNSASDAGAVYVLERDGGGAWSHAAYVKASNAGASDYFGLWLALSGDGDTLAVGARNEDSNATGIDGDQTNGSATDSGAAYVFERDGAGAWSQAAYIKASNTATSDVFGFGVALSDDGNTLALGAPQEDSNATGIDGDQASDATYGSGAVYVLVRDGAGAWSQAAYVKASNTEYDDQFGANVALSGDGNVLAVGAYNEDGGTTGIGGDQASNAVYGAGAVYVLVRDGAGAWSQRAYVKASNTSTNDYFGDAVALSDDGNTLAIGASAEDSSAIGIGGDQGSDAAYDAGAVYLY
jgi:FG-GAP repeat